jgi:hypothetical protein
MRAAGDALRAANVGTLYLIHGTFVGDDLCGWWHQLEKCCGPLPVGRRIHKALVDLVARDLGNFTARYARELAGGLNGDPNERAYGESAGVHQAGLAVERLVWSSQNNHVGRADAALRFLLELSRRSEADQRRVLVWGHSHAGNALALATNLLAADADTLDRFFAALRPNYASWFRRGAPQPVWQAAYDMLRSERQRLRATPLDIVTFGTPIRYGWDPGGYDRLLHVVHLRAENVRPRRDSGLPYRLMDVWRAHEGDYVQRTGIAGTNFPPCWLCRPGPRRADRQLHAIIQAGVTSRGLFDRLRPALRIADEGETVAVNYGPQPGGPLRNLIGHGEYTRRRQMSFHAQLVAERFYGMKTPT